MPVRDSGERSHFRSKESLVQFQLRSLPSPPQADCSVRRKHQVGLELGCPTRDSDLKRQRCHQLFSTFCKHQCKICSQFTVFKCAFSGGCVEEAKRRTRVAQHDKQLCFVDAESHYLETAICSIFRNSQKLTSRFQSIWCHVAARATNVKTPPPPPPPKSPNAACFYGAAAKRASAGDSGVAIKTYPPHAL